MHTRALLRRITRAAALLGMTALTVLAVALPADGRSAHHHTLRQECSDRNPATRDPANPLHLRSAPGANPLNGASFLVPGPATGAAAGAIAQLLGQKPNHLRLSLSWSAFAHRLEHGRLRRKLATHRGLARKVADLSKIAAEPEVQRISSYSWGGTPRGIFKQTEKVLCQIQRADPGSIPILNTYFLHASLGGCPTPGEISRYGARFRARVQAVAAAIARRPVVLLLETDALGYSECLARRGSLAPWEADLRYEVETMRALPHAVVYVEGGYSDANTVGYTARALNAIGVRDIRGFYTNDTHLNWTIKEVRWATAVARRVGGAHFIVNTADNGQGPLLNRHRRANGIENLCNPPGRGLGPRGTTDTGYALADAWMWTHPPGNSSGCGGGPAGGTFWPARAEGEAQRANGRLGLGLPSRPY
jgi:hypothetical protein